MCMFYILIIEQGKYVERMLMLRVTTNIWLIIYHQPHATFEKERGNDGSLLSERNYLLFGKIASAFFLKKEG